MNKRKLHHVLTLIHKVHYFWLIAACIIFAVMGVFSLRANNQRMIELRSAVFAADEKNDGLEESLRELREYVFNHMNTNLSSGFAAVKPPIQLKYQYERLASTAKAEYDAASAKMLADAEATCVAQYPGSVFSQPRLDCAKAYAAANPVPQRTIPDSLYKFDFISPKWSPDLAGWSLLAAALFLLLFVIRFISERAIRHELKRNM